MIATTKKLVGAALVLALVAAGCAAGAVDASAPSGSGDQGAGNSNGGPGAPSPGGSTGGSSGSGTTPISPGGGSPGSGGSSSSAGGSSGSSTTPDAGLPMGNPSDAAASDDAAAGGPGPFACAITLQPLIPTSTNGVPAGEGNVVRIGAVASGNAVPAKPAWHWQVTFQGGAAVPHAAVDGEPAAIEFPTLLAGSYNVQVDVGLPNCLGTATVTAAVPVKPTEFFVRVSPPAGMGLSLLEQNVTVGPGQPTVKALEFESQPPIGHVDPHEGTAALPAYFVQIVSPTSTARFEGYLDTRVTRPPWFDAPLIRGQNYNVLIVPDTFVAANARAPIVFKNLAYDAFAATNFQVDAGIVVAGKVSSSTGPLPRSRLRLRDDLLPSTVGEADPTGAYSLRTRAGRFEARVVPPSDSGLPEAQLPHSAGIMIATGGLGGNLDFAYAPVAMAKLVLTVQKSDGTAPEQPISVVVQSLDGQLANVGKFTVNGQESIVDGVVRLVQDTAAGGTLTVNQLPRAHYRVIMSPPDGLSGDSALTTLDDLDLTGAAAIVTRNAVLAKRGRIVGHLLPVAKSAGLMVRVLDAAEDGVSRNTIIVPVAADGHFEFASDPLRLYRLFVEPPADRRLPRLTLDPVRATAGTVDFNATLPARLSLSGTTSVIGRGPLAGAIVQVYCKGSAPVCVDGSAADVSNTLPIDETLSGADGSYELGLPGATTP